MSAALEPPLYNSVICEIMEFFDVAVHVILYQRNVYPSELFRSVSKYDIKVQQSRHPQLNKYIAKALLEGIHSFLLDGSLTRFVVVLKDQNKGNEIVEQFVFDIEILVDKNAYIEAQQGLRNIKLLRRKLRDLMVKLTTMNSHLPSNSNRTGLTFGIQAHTTQLDTSKHTKWIETEQNNQALDTKRLNYAMIPMKQFKIDELKLNSMIIVKSKRQSDKEEL